MNQALAISAQKTLAYFDQFSHPLTARELFYWLWESSGITEADFLVEVKEIIKTGLVTEKNGYYFLPGRADIIQERAKKFLIQEKKMKLAKSVVQWLAITPFVKGIFICNTVAAGWPSIGSDIDLFVVAKPGRLWLARWVFTGLTTILNRRRHGARITDHLCLSFYITSDNLNLQSVRISKPDIYLTYWVHQLIPLYTEPGLHHDFLLTNSWTKEYLPNSETEIVFQNTVTLPKIVQGIKQLMEFFLNKNLGKKIENKVRDYQLQRINRQERKGPPHVVISDSMLKFHEADRREEYQTKWRQTCTQLGLL